MEEKTQVSEVGFEPGTFRSCVEHSNHYATETPPIPDVLLVLVAPKYINRNVTTTLQSRFTPTPTPQATHSSFIILFYFILFYFILFYFILFYFILFYFILFYFIFVKLLNTSHCSPPPSSLSPPQPALFAEVRTLPIFQHFSSKSLSFNMAHLGLNVSDNIRCDVINPYLLTWRIWGRTFQPLLLLMLQQTLSSRVHWQQKFFSARILATKV